jgi:hypothetical protein
MFSTAYPAPAFECVCISSNPRIYSVSFWPVAHAFPCWSLSIFCCILFFITLKFYKMKVYIIQQNDELKIMKVQPQDEAAFLEEYQNCIVASGASVQEAIQQFAKMKEDE